MRIALISDIHGNNTALNAVLDDVDQHRIDTIICLGDTATIGPQPHQVLARLKALDCPCVTGNHEAVLLEPDSFEKYKIAPQLVPTIQWCVNQLTEDDYDFLRSFKSSEEILLGPDFRMRCFHGSPRSNTENILPSTPARELNRLFANEPAEVIAVGHTHIQMLRSYQGRLIINPGSVGAVFLGPAVPSEAPTLLSRVEYAIVDYTGGALSVDFRRLPLDNEVFIKVIADSDIPLKDSLIEQYSSHPPTG